MEEYRKRIIEDYIRNYNQFDIEGMTKYLSDDVIFENITAGIVNLRTEGLASFIKQAESAVAYFQERKQAITTWKFEEKAVEISIAYQAIVAMDLPNGLKKGAPYGMPTNLCVCKLSFH